jgi:hypothetical protein
LNKINKNEILEPITSTSNLELTSQITTLNKQANRQAERTVEPFKCSECMSGSNRKVKTKAHYTIRRGPGKISHLLAPQQNDLLISFDNNSINKSKSNASIV